MPVLPSCLATFFTLARRCMGSEFFYIRKPPTVYFLKNHTAYIVNCATIIDAEHFVVVAIIDRGEPERSRLELWRGDSPRRMKLWLKASPERAQTPTELWYGDLLQRNIPAFCNVIASLATSPKRTPREPPRFVTSHRRE